MNTRPRFALPLLVALLSVGTGCTINPVTGAATHKIGMESILAPRVSKILLTFAFCNAKPN